MSSVDYLLSLYEQHQEKETNQPPFLKELVNEASKNLKTLVRLYYLRHGFEAMDLFIVIPLMLCGFQCINSINDQTPVEQLEILRSTIILIAKGLHDQRSDFHLASVLFRVLRGRMRLQEAALLKGIITFDENEVDEREAMSQAVRSHWLVSPAQKKEDVETHVLNHLVENYAHMNVEEVEAVGDF